MLLVDSFEATDHAGLEGPIEKGLIPQDLTTKDIDRSGPLGCDSLY